MSFSSGTRSGERRRRRVLVTQNTEYHLDAALVVAVRDRRTGAWLERHLAVGARYTGGVRLFNDGTAELGESEPHLGEALYLLRGERDLITTALLAVERPDRETVADYPPTRAA